MCSDLGSGSRCCLYYSAVGFIFTLFVTVMVNSQPFFIPGLDTNKAPESALGAMFMFVFTFFVSAYGIYYDNQQKENEVDSPDGYQLNPGGLPPNQYGSR